MVNRSDEIFRLIKVPSVLKVVKSAVKIRSALFCFHASVQMLQGCIRSDVDVSQVAYT